MYVQIPIPQGDLGVGILAFAVVVIVFVALRFIPTM